jgi:hypothetical protein
MANYARGGLAMKCGSSCNAEIERLLLLEEASDILRRSRWALRQDIKAGRLRCVRIGRRILIEPRECRRLIEEGSTVKLGD